MAEQVGPRQAQRRLKTARRQLVDEPDFDEILGSATDGPVRAHAEERARPSAHKDVGTRPSGRPVPPMSGRPYTDAGAGQFLPYGVGRADVVKEEVMTSPEPRTATFETTLTASGNNTGIVVPDSVIEQLGAGKRPPVVVEVNGYAYRSTVAVMGGKYLIGLSAAVRAATGLAGGDPIRVTLTVADSPRVVEMPADFPAALEADEAARRFFDTLSNSVQRYHVDNINAAKTPDTRQRRIKKAIGLFLEGKRR